MDPLPIHPHPTWIIGFVLSTRFFRHVFMSNVTNCLTNTWLNYYLNALSHRQCFVVISIKFVSTIKYAGHTTQKENGGVNGSDN